MHIYVSANHHPLTIGQFVLGTALILGIILAIALVSFTEYTKYTQSSNHYLDGVGTGMSIEDQGILIRIHRKSRWIWIQ